MRSHFVLFITCFLFFGLCASAKDSDTVEGEYEYIMPDNQTPEEARIIALKRAKLEALAKKYGTNIIQIDDIFVTDGNDQSKTSLYSLGESEVKGEWVKTIDEKVEEQIVDGHYIFKAWVKGEAREVEFSKVDVETHLLRNGKEDWYEAVDNRFFDGDDFYVSFRSPIKGYLAIFWLDHNRNACRIIPEGDEELFSIKRNKRYVFMDDESKKFILITNRRQEINQVYIIFSPNEIVLPMDEQIADKSDFTRYQKDEYRNISPLPFIPFEKFQKWIVRLRKKDPQVQVVTDFIKISGKE